MSKADEIKARAAKIAARQQSAAQGAPAPEPTREAPSPPLAKPVRTTLDLPPAVHRDLQAWLNESAVQLGRARLTKQQALEVLVKLLLRDPILAKKVIADLKDQ